MDRISGFEPEDGSSILSGGTTKNFAYYSEVFYIFMERNQTTFLIGTK